MKRTSVLSVFLWLIGISLSAHDSHIGSPKMVSQSRLIYGDTFYKSSIAGKAFENDIEDAINRHDPWVKDELLFEDPCTGNWKEKWMLDGQRSKVINTKEGMELIAGPEHGNDTCHTVLWTKQSFEGNICIEYDYTRTDTTTRCVNILYFHATGKGDVNYPVDISLWNDKRIVPHMSTYFNNMNAYHISYAAFAARVYSGDNDYIRLRRYNPDNKGLKGTNVPPDHFKTGLFKPGQTYHIQVYRYNDQIEMHIENKANSEEKLVCKWDVSMFPPCDSGRIGLRHMYTRSARYKNFKVWKISGAALVSSRTSVAEVIPSGMKTLNGIPEMD